MENEVKEIKIDEHDGFFMTEKNETVFDKEEAFEYLEEGEKVYPAIEEQYLCIDLVDTFHDQFADNACGDFDAENYIDLKDDLLIKAQELIDEWIEKQGNSGKIYWKDKKRIVVK